MRAVVQDRYGAAVCDRLILARTCLRKARLGPGRRILIYGASGSIGTAGVQLARQRAGARRPEGRRDVGVSDADWAWWLGADLVWRRGTPPAGWREVRPGRWAPPSGADDTTEELALVGEAPVLAERPEAEPVQPGHLIVASGTAALRRRGQPIPGRGWPPNARTLATLLVVLGLAAVLAAAAASLTGPDAGRAGAPSGQPPPPSVPGRPGTSDAPGDAAPSMTVATSTSTSPSSSTATRSPASPSPAIAPTSDPLTACSPGQRRLIERGGHPLSWYLERFDHDGDGVLCT
jgi:hypothetical protein